MIYEELLNEAASNDIYVIENAVFESQSDGLINNDVIGINKKIRDSRTRACVLAEELGHFYTTTGDIIDQEEVQNRKQELHARSWAYDRLIGLNAIIDCYKAGCKTLYEMADHLDVTEAFLGKALEHYHRKCGLYKTLDNYVIYFEPHLCVFELRTKNEILIPSTN